MAIKYITVPTKRLSATIDGLATSFQPSDILGWNGNALTSADLSSRAWAVFRNSANTLMEIMEIDPTTIANSSITIITRGLKFDGDTSTVVAANKLTWIKGDTIVELGTSVPQLLAQAVNTTDAQTINGQKTFIASPQVPTGSSGLDAVNYAQIASFIISGGVDASTIAKGVSRLTASPASALGNPTITIAGPAVVTLNAHGLTADDSVVFTTSGTLPTGIVSGNTYFVISAGLTANTFEISGTIGGSPITTTGSQSGTHTLTRTTPRAIGENDSRVLTIAQAQANAGTSGTPSSTNKFVTQNDTTNSATETATTISFTAASSTISDSGSGFVTAGFQTGQTITITGSASNNITTTIASVAAGAIVVAGVLVNESSGASVTIVAAKIGKVVRTNASGFIDPSFLSGNAVISLLAAESIIAGQSIAAGFYQSDGGIKIDGTPVGTNNSSSTTLTQSVTVGNNANRILVVSVSHAVGTISSVTYGGVAMTNVAGASDSLIGVYYILAPTVGTANVVATLSTGTSQFAAVICHSYYNAFQGTPDSQGVGSGTTTVALTSNPSTDGCLVYAASTTSNGNAGLAGLTQNAVQIGSATNGYELIYAGDLGFNTPNQSFGFTMSGGSSAMHAGYINIKPITAPIYGYAVRATSEAVGSYPIVATTTFRQSAFIGFALNSASATQPVNVQMSNEIINQSGLIPLKQYYLNDTIGTIGLSPGTNSRKVGIAISATSLVITNNW